MTPVPQPAAQVFLTGRKFALRPDGAARSSARQAHPSGRRPRRPGL